MAVNSRASASLVLPILNRTFPVTELAPVLLLLVDPTPLTTMTAVAHPVDTALAVMVTATEALLAVVTMMRSVVATAPLRELVALLMTTHLHVAALRTRTVVTTHPTHTSMVDLLMIDHRHGITHPEILLTIMSALAHVIDLQPNPDMIRSYDGQ